MEAKHYLPMFRNPSVNGPLRGCLETGGRLLEVEAKEFRSWGPSINLFGFFAAGLFLTLFWQYSDVVDTLLQWRTLLRIIVLSDWEKPRLSLLHSMQNIVRCTL